MKQLYTDKFEKVDLNGPIPREVAKQTQMSGTSTAGARRGEERAVR